MLVIRDFQREVHELAKEKGWWWNKSLTNITTEKLCLIHCEVSEAVEVLRQHHVDMVKKEFGTELADIVIRVLDLAEFHNIDLGQILLEKHEYNKKRAIRHGKRF
jgi:NTP pyrophosphatase (non-canonical NTP hydrolase)